MDWSVSVISSGSRIIDVTVPFSAELPVWPGDPPIELRPLERIADGASSNVTQIVCPTHCGTHVDPPWHFVDDGARLDSVPLERWIGPSQVVEIPGTRDLIQAADLQSAGVAPETTRLLLKTANSRKWRQPTSRLETDYVALTPDAAAWVVQRRIRLIGIDYLSIECWDDHSNATHRTLLGNDVLVIEGLDLRDVEPGHYTLVCMPLRIRDGDGAPARVALIAP
jgi:arylformamidase